MKWAQSLFAAALLASATLTGAADAGRETTGQYIDDAAITTKVKSAFVRDEVIKTLGVQVETYRGTVQLAGFASSQAEIRRAEILARSVPGVSGVKNDIRLKPQQSSRE